MIGHGIEVDFKIGPFGLRPQLEPLIDPGRTAGGGSHQEMVFTDKP